MPKAKSLKGKRTVSCGKCKKDGHNARTCPDKVAPVIAESIAPEVVPVREVTLEPTTEVVPAPVVSIEKPEVHNPRKREAPTGDRGSKMSAAPYRCAKCNSVSILVIVRVKDHQESFRQKRDIFMGETRCEQCMNKPNPAELILKWGAGPNEKIKVDNTPDA